LKNIDNDDLLLELLVLINNLINEAKKLNERIRIRHQFIGLKLYDLFIKIEEKYSSKNKMIMDQIDIFKKSNNKDDENYSILNDVDLNNIIDIFHAICLQVC
jgi:hypothetical protein